MHDALHSLGFPVVYHTCGGMMPILELIVENGCDACETLTLPLMGGDARPRVAGLGTLARLGTPEGPASPSIDSGMRSSR